ncbi:hypothetical protein CDAR_548791 [Caerostris darwini]|uniref:Uncharacterized protein n=1 Tax=Caerostris darwini TaxID=1538125 RepID=A0AAV4WIX0_9ARAC|nr:hypothetical protein CDAR_548791 [Caerostris darwini]
MTLIAQFPCDRIELSGRTAARGRALRRPRFDEFRAKSVASTKWTERVLVWTGGQHRWVSEVLERAKLGQKSLVSLLGDELDKSVRRIEEVEEDGRRLLIPIHLTLGQFQIKCLTFEK